MAASSHLAILPVPGGAVSPVSILPSEVPPSRAALTLYAIEDQLAALVETLDLVPADREDELVARIGDALLYAVDKRDSMGRFLAHVDSQIGFADAEIQRLQERKQTFTRILERTEAYIVRILQSLGQDAKGKWQKLEGRTVTFSLRKQPPSVAIDNEADVPSAYRKATIRVAVPLWEELLDSVDADLAGRVLNMARRSDEVSKSAIKESIEGGAEVPGAHLVTDGVKLKRG
jgi:hypothetical protein